MSSLTTLGGVRFAKSSDDVILGVAKLHRTVSDSVRDCVARKRSLCSFSTFHFSVTSSNQYFTSIISHGHLGPASRITSPRSRSKDKVVRRARKTALPPTSSRNLLSSDNLEIVI